jgi:hypothetical protein
MLISTIVLIIVRLFSVSWFVQSLGMFAGAIATFGDPQMNDNSSSWLVAFKFIPPFVMFLFAVIAWIIAPFLSRFIAGKYDAPIAISGLSLQDLYSFGFVFLGLYFILSSMGGFLYSFFYSLTIAASHDFDPERKKSLYENLRPSVTMVAGFISLTYGKIWAKKLLDKAD